MSVCALVARLVRLFFKALSFLLKHTDVCTICVSPCVLPYVVYQFCSLLAFSIMSSQQSFDKQSAFGFLVFACVVTWIFVLFILPAHVTDCHSQ